MSWFVVPLSDCWRLVLFCPNCSVWLRGKCGKAKMKQQLQSNGCNVAFGCYLPQNERKREGKRNGTLDAVLFIVLFSTKIVFNPPHPNGLFSSQTQTQTHSWKVSLPFTILRIMFGR